MGLGLGLGLGLGAGVGVEARDRSLCHTVRVDMVERLVRRTVRRLQVRLGLGQRSDNFNESVILLMGQHKYEVTFSNICPTMGWG